VELFQGGVGDEVGEVRSVGRPEGRINVDQARTSGK
jgi:hypothetical protein